MTVIQNDQSNPIFMVYRLDLERLQIFRQYLSICAMLSHAQDCYRRNLILDSKTTDIINKEFHGKHLL